MIQKKWYLLRNKNENFWFIKHWWKGKYYFPRWVYNSKYLPLAISKGFDVNCKNEHGDTIFHRDHHSKYLPLAIEKGFNVNCQDNNGCTIFHYEYHSDYLPLAIENGFDFNCKNNNGDTIFHYGHHSEHLKLAIEKGFDVNCKMTITMVTILYFITRLIQPIYH